MRWAAASEDGTPATPQHCNNQQKWEREEDEATITPGELYTSINWEVPSRQE